jgi:hypothetical protein
MKFILPTAFLFSMVTMAMAGIAGKVSCANLADLNFCQRSALYSSGASLSISNNDGTFDSPKMSCTLLTKLIINTCKQSCLIVSSSSDVVVQMKDHIILMTVSRNCLLFGEVLLLNWLTCITTSKIIHNMLIIFFTTKSMCKNCCPA